MQCPELKVTRARDAAQNWPGPLLCKGVTQEKKSILPLRIIVEV